MTPDWITAAWLTLLGAVGLAYFLWLYWRSDYSTWESCLYAPTYLLGRLLWRVHFTNRAPDELRSGGVLAANHRSSVDPFFVQLAARRRVHWMVAKEYCLHTVFGPLLRALQVIPTNRSGMDTASTKTAMRITQDGRLVGMFPEGKINRTPQALLPLRGGAALVAIRSQVPIIPLWIEGSPLGNSIWSPAFMPARVKITFGTPIYPQPSRTQSNGSQPNGSANENSNHQPDSTLTESDALIVQWGTQMLALAGETTAAVELASQRKLRNRTS